MLTHLNIQGLAIIDSLAIEFSPGFNVITGETGAGKSILIKALGLLLGAKASTETVRRGRDAASVSGLFEAPLGHPAGEILRRYGVTVETEDAGFPILVRRMVNSKGRSFAWVNDVPVTVAVLRELAGSLIDVFGQHENLRLLDSSQHLAYVDQFLKDQSCLTTYLETYAAVQSLVHELSGMVEGFRSRRRDADYLGYRCEELRKFAPTRDDYGGVQGLCRRGSQQMTQLAGLEAARALVDQGAGGEPLGQPLWEAGRVLGKLASVQPELTEVAGLATALAAQVDELSYQVGKAISRLEVDETDLEAAQARLAGYQELVRKLAVHDIDELLSTQARLVGELGFL
jgi:DNA repair protein RecN (Recombination protein N)